MVPMSWKEKQCLKNMQYKGFLIFSMYEDPVLANTLLVAVDQPDLNVVDDALNVAIGLKGRLETLSNKPDGYVDVTMIPTFDQDGTPRIANMTYNDATKFALKLHREHADELDSIWKKFKLDKTILTGMVPFMNQEGKFGFYREPVTTEYSVPNSLKERLIETMSATSKIPEDRYFVSSQVVSVKNAFSDGGVTWGDFYEQALSKVVDGQSFVKHTYDKQVLREKSFHIPMYGLFVSAYFNLPRVVRIQDYKNFVMGFYAQFLNENSHEADTFFHEISPQLFTAGLSVMEPKQVATLYNKMSGSLVKKAEDYLKENAEEAKEKKGGFFQRFFSKNRNGTVNKEN